MLSYWHYHCFVTVTMFKISVMNECLKMNMNANYKPIFPLDCFDLTKQA